MDDDVIITKEDLNEALDSYLTKRHHCRIGIEKISHEKEHEFLRLKMGEEQRRYERWEKIQSSAIGAVVVAAIGGIVSFLGWIGSLVIKTLNS